MIMLMSSAHVNVAADASESNDGWVSIAGKAWSDFIFTNMSGAS
jgi:hypothetical protein